MQHETTNLPPFMEADGLFFLTLANDRATVAYTIERLIDMLDAMEPDPDLEPYLAGCHHNDQMVDLEGDESLYGDCDREPSLGWAANGQHGQCAGFATIFGDLEEQCEDEGACIQSQPHDERDEGNAEPFLGWSEHQSLHGAIATGDEFPRQGNGPAHFDGDGCVAARRVLNNLREARPDVPQEYIGGWSNGSYEALRVEGLTIRSNKGRERLGPDELTILRPGVAMVGGYRESAVMRAIEPRDDGLIPEIDPLAHYRAAHGQRA